MCRMRRDYLVRWKMYLRLGCNFQLGGKLESGRRPVRVYSDDTFTRTRNKWQSFWISRNTFFVNPRDRSSTRSEEWILASRSFQTLNEFKNFLLKSFPPPPTNCYAKHTFHEQRVNASRVEGKTNYTRSPISQTGAFLRVPKRTKKPTPQYINPARSKQNRTKKKLRNQTRHQQRFPLSRRRSEQHCKHRIPPLLYHGSWSARCNQLLLSTFQSQSTRKTPFPSRLKNST